MTRNNTDDCWTEMEEGDEPGGLRGRNPDSSVSPQYEDHLLPERDGEREQTS